jgi:NADPH:quinone reductase-like Zn-dependent oxidoreductase
MARVRIGDRVLVQSGAGGVGLAAVQIATQAGANVVAMVGSVPKADVAREFGAKEAILNQQWAKCERANVQKEFGRFDIILDSTGGENLKKSFDALAPGGRVVNFGVSDLTSNEKKSMFKVAGFLLQTPLFTPFQLMNTNRGIFGLNLLKLLENPELISRVFQKVIDGFESGTYRVKIGKTFALDDAGSAQSWLQSRQNIGKVILTV